MKDIFLLDFRSFAESVPAALDAVGAAPALAEQERILIKPNLVNASPPPVTTPVECVEAIASYVREHAPQTEIVVGEGCGEACLDTDEIFKRLGYVEMAKRTGVELLDLNYAPLVHLQRPDCPVFPEMYLPQIAMESFLISVPTLKAHSLATITGSLKNMMGLCPPKHYGHGGSYKKAAFHASMQQSVMDLNRYRLPDLTLMDASVGLAEYHLGGPECDPHVRKLIAGFDPYAVDRAAAELLGLDWRGIRHLTGTGEDLSGGEGYPYGQCQE